MSDPVPTYEPEMEPVVPTEDVAPRVVGVESTETDEENVDDLEEHNTSQHETIDVNISKQESIESRLAQEEFTRELVADVTMLEKECLEHALNICTLDANLRLVLCAFEKHTCQCLCCWFYRCPTAKLLPKLDGCVEDWTRCNENVQLYNVTELENLDSSMADRDRYQHYLENSERLKRSHKYIAHLKNLAGLEWRQLMTMAVQNTKLCCSLRDKVSCRVEMMRVFVREYERIRKENSFKWLSPMCSGTRELTELIFQLQKEFCKKTVKPDQDVNVKRVIENYFDYDIKTLLLSSK